MEPTPEKVHELCYVRYMTRVRGDYDNVGWVGWNDTERDDEPAFSAFRYDTWPAGARGMSSKYVDDHWCAVCPIQAIGSRVMLVPSLGTVWRDLEDAQDIDRALLADHDYFYDITATALLDDADDAPAVDLDKS